MAKVLRWVGIGVGISAVILVIACVAIYAASNRKLHRAYSAPTPSLTIATDSATINRGQHLAFAIAKCVDCHGEDLGGNVIIPDPKFMVLVAPNLTKSSSGRGGTLTDADIARAVRNGVKRDGTPLILMPASEFRRFSDADLSAIIAWVRSKPPVDRPQPVTKPGPISRILFAFNLLPIISAELVDPATPTPATPPAGPTKEYGEYLATVGLCQGCHGPGLSGGPIPGTPPEFKPAANITPTVTRTWTEADFFRVLREGKSPRGVQLDSLMPYKYTRLMSDDEIRAVWAYLQTVPPKEYGGR